MEPGDASLSVLFLEHNLQPAEIQLQAFHPSTFPENAPVAFFFYALIRVGNVDQQPRKFQTYLPPLLNRGIPLSVPEWRQKVPSRLGESTKHNTQANVVYPARVRSREARRIDLAVLDQVKPCLVLIIDEMYHWRDTCVVLGHR